MKKALLALILMLGYAQFAQGQSTTVSGTVTDLGSQTWNNGSYTFTFVPNPQYPTGPYTWTGGALALNISGALSGSGAYSVSIPSNTAISPIGSKWQVTFCPQATSQCYTTTPVTIQGGTQTLNAAPPAILINLTTPSAFTSAYADAEISGATVGAFYYNLTSAVQRICTAVTGQACTTWASQGGGSGFTPQINGTPLSTAGLNLETSTTNATGLTCTPTLVSTINVIPCEVSGTITSAHVATLNQSTTGTAANLSGTPALPNGTTATTQSVADNTTKIATDAFVIANAGSGFTPQINGTPLSTAGLNLETSTTNATGLTCTPTLVSTINVIPCEVSGTITSAHVATLNQNTSGTAANLSGTPALPNGTTAITQTTGDNSTKLATDAFVIANAGGVPTLPTTPNGIAQQLTSTPSGGVGGAATWSIPGVPIDSQTGTSYTVPITDNLSLLTGNNAAATAWTGFALANNYGFAFENLGAGLITYTPASGTVNSAATQIIPQNWFGFHYTNNTNTFMPVLPTIAAFPSCPDSGGNHINFTTATGAISCGTSSSGGGAALSAITAATTSATIASGDNPIIWNWKGTTAARHAFQIGETTASTSTGAAELVDIATLSASTMVPLTVETANNFGTPDIFDVKMNGAVIGGFDGNGGLNWGKTSNQVCLSSSACTFNSTNQVDFVFSPNSTFSMGIPSLTGAQGSYVRIANPAATPPVTSESLILTGAPSTGTVGLTTSTNNVVGVCEGACVVAGTTANSSAEMHPGDIAPLAFDATATVAGDCVIASTTVAGKFHDNGAPPCNIGVDYIGIVLASGSASTTQNTLLALRRGAAGNVDKLAQVAAITTQTIITTVNAGAYRITAPISCTASSAGATATLTIGWTDTSSTAQTATALATCTTLGSGSIATVQTTFNAKAATTITYAVAIANTPTYDLRILLEGPF